MAEQTSQDVVIQTQSVDDPSSTDVSAVPNTDLAARAVPEQITPATVSDLKFTNVEATAKDSELDAALAPTAEQIPSAQEEAKVSYGAGKGVQIGNLIVRAQTTDPGLDFQPLDPKVNGLRRGSSQDLEGTEEGSVRSIGVDVDGSVESDTDTSKIDTADGARKDAAENMESNRTSSMKKPASFKPVSVTKNFLAKASTASTPTSKTMDKGNLRVAAKVNTQAKRCTGNASAVTTTSNSSQSAPRPRLVAKAVSGHRAATPKAMNLNSKSGKGGPDPNQVWNRNRVATPQATPKHLTDEELKQQYGIHLASRLQEDGDGKEAKWADIDDDEDDWAPETIEWNDGTTINVAQLDTAAQLAEEQAASAAQKKKDEEAEAAKAKIALAKPTTTVGPNATVLKLGSGVQSKSGGLVLKAPSEKPTLVAKPASSTPVRSPWASLPPVDKVPPVPINPPTQTPSPRFAQRDPHGFDAMPPPPAHTKEIAADDFSRSSRDYQNGMPKELFNSQSGRYEPVNETRRGSVRKDQNFRAPSLLQRPQHDHHGPAEPSPAFQTNRSQQDGGHWTRRRSSSITSGGSGNFDRRGSVKASDLPRVFDEAIQPRRGSIYDRSPMTPGYTKPQSPMVNGSQTVQSDSSTVSPQLAKAVPDGVQPPGGKDPNLDAIAVQRKIMKEKREAAIKRKKEEEEREEAEKKERLRIKIEQLVSLEEKRGKRETAEEAPKASAVQPSEPQEIKATAPQSPPKPPLPDPSGAPQQYGMMKLHGPHPTNGLSPKSSIHEKEVFEAHRAEAKPPSDPVTAHTSPTRELKPTVNGVVDPSLETLSHPLDDNNNLNLSSSSKPQSHPQPWNNVQQDSSVYPTWNGTGMTTHSSSTGNVWGPPPHHRALGNGDFINPNPRAHPRSSQYPSHQISPQPQPIGPPQRHVQPPVANHLAPKLQEPLTNNEVLPYPPAEDSQTIPAYPSPEKSLGPSNHQNRAQDSNSYARVDQQLRSNPPLPNRGLPVQQPNSFKDANEKAAWADFSAKSQQAVAERKSRETALLEERRAGVKQGLALPVLNETWRPIKMGENGGREAGEAFTSINQDQNQGLGQYAAFDAPKEVFSKLPSPAINAPPSRSRFFMAGQAILPQSQRAVSSPLSFVRSISPPPPDSTDHPVQSGMHQPPVVLLPKAKPTVRLPPAPSVPKEASVPAAPVDVRVQSLRAVSQPLVANPSWQDRFNGLFENRKKSPEKKFANVIDFSTSKVPLELATVDNPAVITLPPKDEDELIGAAQSEDEPTKAVEDEDALFEERDFGSVPTVRIPDHPPVRDWHEVKSSKGFRLRAKHLSEVDVQSTTPLEDENRKTPSTITIKLSGWAQSKYKQIHRSSYQGNGRPQHSPRSSSLRGKPGKGSRPTESSPTFGPSRYNNNTPQARSVVHAASPQQPPKPPMSWARRASGQVH
ncbi:MAG: hypothetical protein MMC33_010036 [Icmadophila ericetorum]|nr:hypothetical protein [Icmadophila ericetorum]